jgi:hypothetical protein
MADTVQKIFSFNPTAGQAVQTAMSSLQQAMDMARGAFDQISRVSAETFDNLSQTTAAGKHTKGK